MSINDVLNMPYPLYRDIIEAQVKEKKDQKKRFDEEMKKKQNK